MNWDDSLTTLQENLASIQNARSNLEAALEQVREYESQAAAEIAMALRQSGGIKLNLDAIKATPPRPYALVPTGKPGEYKLIAWRGVEMPLFGILEKQDAVFNYFRVSAWMDLVTPIPDWAKEELGIEPPEHGAAIDAGRSSISVAWGDSKTFRRKYGAFLGKESHPGVFSIKPGDNWIRLVESLLKDRILPYVPQPVATEHWDASAKSPIALREYQLPAVTHFLEYGSMTLLLPPGAGKTFIATFILAHFKGRVLLIADGDLGVSHWKAFLSQHAPDAKITLTTYQGALKFLNQEFDLLIDDEAHHIAANTFSKYAFIQTKYRIGLTATALREDGREHWIIAFNGKPFHISWAQLIQAGILKKPNINVAKVRDLAHKTQFVKQLIAKHKKGHALIFCDWLDQGKQLASELDVPFVHGETKLKLETIQANRVCVVSRIADTTLDLPELTLLVDYGFQKHARAGGAQRLGRLLHTDTGGDYYMLLTTEEAASDPRRLYGVQQELMGIADIEYLDLTGASPQVAKSLPKLANVAAKTKQARTPKDPTDALLANPAVNRFLDECYAKAPKQVRDEKSIHLVLKLAWDGPVSLEELRIGKGAGKSALWKYGAAFKIAAKAGLVTQKGDHYQTDVKKLEHLASLTRFNFQAGS
jgi:DNA excision repair protein ERCC-3